MDENKQIEKLRAQCLVHRYLYYVKCESLISDFEYDKLERELRRLVETHPNIAETAKFAEDCPTKKVGSDMLEDYPKQIQLLGESLLIYNPDNLDWWAKVTDEENKYEIKAAEPILVQRSIFD